MFNEKDLTRVLNKVNQDVAIGGITNSEPYKELQNSIFEIISEIIEEILETVLGKKISTKVVSVFITILKDLRKPILVGDKSIQLNLGPLNDIIDSIETKFSKDDEILYWKDLYNDLLIEFNTIVKNEEKLKEEIETLKKEISLQEDQIKNLKFYRDQLKNWLSKKIELWTRLIDRKKIEGKSHQYEDGGLWAYRQSFNKLKALFNL